MLFNYSILSLAALAGMVSAVCPASTRLKSAQQVIYAYNLSPLGASAEAFKSVPWGAPDAPGVCLTTIIADGTCPIPVALTGSGTYQFAVESRQAFSHLTGEYVSFNNGTTLINTNVTLGIRDAAGIPITFTGHVYMDYNDDCRIYSARAFAQVPISVLNQSFTTAGLPSLPQAVCDIIPKKRELKIPPSRSGNGYLESITQANVTVFRNVGLEQVTPTGFVGPDGKNHEVDVIILATGFNTSWVPPFPITACGINLQDLYRDRPIGYLGVAAPQMPNFFTIYGPYGPLGSGSAMPMITSFVNYIVQMVRHVQTEDILSVTPKQDVIDQYAEHADLFNDRTVWNAPCRSWFKNNKIDGRILLHPGSRNQYLELMDRPRLQDYDHVYRSKNMWSWLGNGFSLRDSDGRDLTWYLGMVNGKDKQTRFNVDELKHCPGEDAAVES